MGKSSPAPPPAPDPYATSAAQTASNKETALYQSGLNNPNQYTPYGSSTRSYQGLDALGAPIYNNNINLTPIGQQLLDSQQQQDTQINNIAQGYMGQIQNTMGNQYSYAGLPQIAGSQDLSKDMQMQQDALYNRQTSMLDPQYAQGKQTMDATLANQGIMQGSDAYNTAQDNFARQKDFAYGQARDSAITGAGAEQSRLYDLSAQNRQQSIQEYNQQREAPLNEFNALRSSSQVQNPTFSQPNATNVGGTNVSGNIQSAYTGQQNAYNQQIGMQNSQTQGLYGLGGTALMAASMFSDIRLKENIECIGETPGGLGVYEFNYIGDPTPKTGVMAQEVELSIPEAVIVDASGYKMVNYGMLR